MSDDSRAFYEFVRNNPVPRNPPSRLLPPLSVCMKSSMVACPAFCLELVFLLAAWITAIVVTTGWLVAHPPALAGLVSALAVPIALVPVGGLFLRRRARTLLVRGQIVRATVLRFHPASIANDQVCAWCVDLTVPVGSATKAVHRFLPVTSWKEALETKGSVDVVIDGTRVNNLEVLWDEFMPAPPA